MALRRFIVCDLKGEPTRCDEHILYWILFRGTTLRLTRRRLVGRSNQGLAAGSVLVLLEEVRPIEEASAPIHQRWDGVLTRRRRRFQIDTDRKRRTAESHRRERLSKAVSSVALEIR